MPKKYRVDGVEYTVPDDATLEQVVEHVQSKSAWAPGDVGQQFYQPPSPPSDAPYRLPGEPVTEYLKRRLTFQNIIRDNPILAQEIGGAKKIPQLALGLGQAVTNLASPVLPASITGNQAFRNETLNKARAWFDPINTAEKVGGFGMTGALASAPALLGGGLGALALAGQGAASGALIQSSEAGKIDKDTLGAAMMGAGLNVLGPPVGSAVMKTANKVFNALAPKTIRSGWFKNAMTNSILVRALRMGKDPVAELEKQKIPVSMSESAAELLPKIDKRLNEIGPAIDNIAKSVQQPVIDASKTYDVGAPQFVKEIIDDAITGLRDDAIATVNPALNQVADLTENISKAWANRASGLGPATVDMTPMQALQLKRAISDRLTFGPNPALGKGNTDHHRTMEAGKRMLKELDKQLGTALGPEFANLNSQYSNLQPAFRAVQDKVFTEMADKPWLFKEIPKKVLWGSGLGLSGTGYWLYRRSRP